MTIKIKLNTITDVANFVSLCSKCIGDVLVHSGRYIVDGKSLMGLYSLNLSDAIRVEFSGDVPAEVSEGMKEYIVE